MSRQPSFNAYEAVLLLDAYLKIIDEGESIREAARSCSKLLRQMAINSGIEIDASYRNADGIRMQLSRMESAFQGETVSLPTTRLFNMIVKMYRDRNSEYEILLSEAISMAASATDNENKFLTWLSGKVSPAQLSELYIAYQMVENQAREDDLIQASLFEQPNSNFFNQIRVRLEQSRTIKNKFKGKASAVDGIIKYLIQYVEEFNVPQIDSEKTDLNLKIFPGNSQGEISVASIMGINVSADSNDERYHSETKVVDFDHIDDLAYTKPVAIYLENVSIIDLQSWTDLYVRFVRFLTQSYSKDLSGYIGINFSSGKAGRADLDYRHRISKMVAPKQISPSIYLETNLSAKDIVGKIKVLAHICHINIKSITIKYKKKERSLQTHVTTPHPTKEEDFYRWLLETQHKAEPTCKGYVSAIRSAERFAKERGLQATQLFTDEYEEAKLTASILSCNPEFIKFNIDRHNQFSAAINQLMLFYANTQGARTQPSKSAESISGLKETSCNYEIDSILEGEDYIILRDALIRQNITTIEQLKNLKLWDFMNRLNLYSIAMRQRIFTKVSEILCELDVNGSYMIYVLVVGDKRYNGKTIADAFVRYCADMLGKYPLQLRSLVGMRTPDGSIPIYKDGVVPLFVKVPGINAYVRGTLSDEDVISYINWIQSRCGEKTVYVSVIESQNSQITPDVNGIEITNDNSTVTVSNVILSDYDSTVQENLSLTDIIEQYVLATDLQGASFDDIKKHTQTTMLDVKRAVVGSMLLVEVKGRVIHKEAFVDWEEGANQLENIMEKLMKKNNGYISASQLYEFAKVEMNMFLNDNDLNDERSVFDIAAHLFGKEDYHGKHYSFIGKTHISRSNQQVTANIDIYRNYAAEQGGFFYLSSLEEYLISVGLSISNLRAQMRIPNEPIFFYYDAGMLICADSMHIDDDWFNSMKKELHDLLMDTDGHIIMRLIPEFWLERLPTLPGRKLWTPLLLQSILRCYSKELGVRTIQALKGQSIETLHSMLVSNDSPIQTFGDVVVLYLVENEISKRDFEAEKLRLMLVDAGIIQGNELIWNMHKALDKDERFAWNATNDHVTVDI